MTRFRPTNFLLQVSGRLARPRPLLVLLVLYFFFALVVMPASMHGGGESLDVRFWYTPQDVYRILGSVDAPTRMASVRGHLTADLFYPLLYGSLLGALLSALVRALGGARTPFSLLPLLPWGAVFADLLENLSVVVLSLSYPARLDWLARFSAFCTAAKWSGVAISLLLIAGGGIVLGLQRVRLL